MERHWDQILNTGKYPQYRQILGTENRTRFYSQYRKIPSATVGNHMGTHQIPLNTFGNPEYSNFLTFSPTDTKQQQKAICSRASILFIWPNPVKIQIYWQLLLATQILPSNTQVFNGIWVANIKYRILSNTAKYYNYGSLRKQPPHIGRLSNPPRETVFLGGFESPPDM